MSQYQRFKSIKPSSEESDYLHDKCPDCSGHGCYFPSSGIPLHSVACPTCKGTGHGKVNKSKLSTILLICLLLFVVGCGICKLLNL